MELLGNLPWRKSTYSGTSGGSCVEVASTTGHILIRDTTDREGAVLSISPNAWQTFTASMN
jgi:hypothetical protein